MPHLYQGSIFSLGPVRQVQISSCPVIMHKTLLFSLYLTHVTLQTVFSGFYVGLRRYIQKWNSKHFSLHCI